MSKEEVRTYIKGKMCIAISVGGMIAALIMALVFTSVIPMWLGPFVMISVFGLLNWCLADPLTDMIINKLDIYQEVNGKRSSDLEK